MKDTLNQLYEEIVLPKIRAAAGSTVQITVNDVEGDIPLLFLLLHHLIRVKHLDANLHKNTITINLN